MHACVNTYMYCIVEREMTRSTLRLVTAPPAPFVCFAVVLAVVRAMRVTHVHSLVGYGAARRSYSHVFHPLAGRAAHLCPFIPSRARCLGRSSQILPPNGDGDTRAPQPRASHPILVLLQCHGFVAPKMGDLFDERTHAFQCNGLTMIPACLAFPWLQRCTPSDASTPK